MNFRWRAYTGQRRRYEKFRRWLWSEQFWFLSGNPCQAQLHKQVRRETSCFVSKTTGRLQSTATKAIMNHFVPSPPPFPIPRQSMSRPSGQELLGFLLSTPIIYYACTKYLFCIIFSHTWSHLSTAFSQMRKLKLKGHIYWQSQC